MPPADDPLKFAGDWDLVSEGAPPDTIELIPLDTDDEDPDFDPFILPALTKEELDAL